MNRNKFLAVVAGACILCQSWTVSALDEQKADPVKQIFKVVSYVFDEVNDAYVSNGYGSAVLIDKNKIITNAHVILGADKKPTGNYNVCVSDSFRNPPKCLSALKLIRYDTENDLALLQPVKNVDLGASVVADNRDLNLGEAVRVYGYPENGGKTITMTEGKISGMEKEHYKIDANIDSGNSGGGAFDASGKFIGIPYVASVGLSTLGYIIPVKNIEKFLDNKTKSEAYRDNVDEKFLQEINRVNKIQQSGDIDTSFLKLSGFAASGFYLDNNLESRDGKVAAYYYYTKDEQTWISINATDEYGSSIFDVLSDDVIKKESQEVNTSVVIKRNFMLKGIRIPRMILRRGYTNKDGTKEENYLSMQFSFPGFTYRVSTDDFTKEKTNVLKGIALFIKNYPKLVLKSQNPSSFEHLGIKMQIPENVNLYRMINDEGTGMANSLTFSSFGKNERNEGMINIGKYPLSDEALKSFDKETASRSFIIGMYRGILSEMEKEESEYDISRELKMNKQGHKYISLVFRDKKTGRVTCFTSFLFMKQNNLFGVTISVAGDSDVRVTEAYNTLVDSVVIPGDFPFRDARLGVIELEK